MTNARRLTRKHFSFFALAVICLLFASLAAGVRPVGAKKGVPSGKGPAPKKAALSLPQAETAASDVGAWELQANGSTVDASWPITPIHINLLPNGKVLFWGRDKSADNQGWDIQDFTTARVWDPFYKSFTPVDNNRTNLFCSGHSFLPDGRLLVAGGHELHPDPTKRDAEGIGSKHINIFDYRTNQWSPGPDMNNGRWYPFNVTLGNGETLIVAGTYLNTNTSPPSSARNLIAQISDVAGNLRTVAPIQHGGNRPPIQNYPFLHLLPDGRVLVAGDGTENRSVYLNTSSSNGGGFWSRAPSLSHMHDTGTSVLYESGKVMITGGRIGVQNTNTTELFDLAVANGSITWRQLAFGMHFQRMHHTSTLLPDGQVLITGGTSCDGTNEIDCGNGRGAVKTPELWNPQTELSTMMAPHSEVRVYHSTAMLLPDGRVLVGGGGLPGAAGEAALGAPLRKFEHKNVEFYNPPYFFLPSTGGAAPRPAIASAPKVVVYGQTFNVSVGNVPAQEVAGAVLIKLGAVTHGFNQDQRRVPLSITATGARTLNVTAPTNVNECPPGHYMLFLLKENEGRLTPSVAKIVRVNPISASSTQQVFGGAAEARSLAVRASTNTTWTATIDSGSNFITLTSATTPVTGNGALSFTVAANSGEQRTGKITVRLSGQPVFNQEIFIYQGKSFSDVTPASTAEDWAGKLSAMKITGGCGGGQFCPNRLVNRGETAVFFVAAAHGPEGRPPAISTVTFSDVLDGHPFHDFIEDFAKRGFSGGCGEGQFCPTRIVTRGELAVFLVRALDLNLPAATTQTFTDVAPSNGFHRFIEEVAARGLMAGCGNGQFCPGAGVTRLEMANALSRAYGF